MGHRVGALSGYESRAALLKELRLRSEGEVYRIRFGPLRADPRFLFTQAEIIRSPLILRRAAERAGIPLGANAGAYERTGRVCVVSQTFSACRKR